MPLYDYTCEECGPFRAWRSMSEAAAPEDCPDCAQKAQRAMAAPFVTYMNPHTRIAHQRNEKSAAEPKMVRRQSKAHDHGHGKGHSHPSHKHGPSRPWMIGH